MEEINKCAWCCLCIYGRIEGMEVYCKGRPVVKERLNEECEDFRCITEKSDK